MNMYFIKIKLSIVGLLVVYFLSISFSQSMYPCGDPNGVAGGSGHYTYCTGKVKAVKYEFSLDNSRGLILTFVKEGVEYDLLFSPEVLNEQFSTHNLNFTRNDLDRIMSILLFAKVYDFEVTIYTELPINWPGRGLVGSFTQVSIE